MKNCSNTALTYTMPPNDKIKQLRKNIAEAEEAIITSDNKLLDCEKKMFEDIYTFEAWRATFASLSITHRANKKNLENLQEELKELIDKTYRHQDKPLFKINYALSNKLYFRRK